MTYLGKPQLANFRPSRAERAKGKPKRDRDGNDEAYLRLIRQLPSCISGEWPVEAHHLRCTGERGVGMKSTDRWAIPLTTEEHRDVHRVGTKKEQAWFRERGIECLDLAGALWSNKHSLEAMMAVLQAHREDTHP